MGEIVEGTAINGGAGGRDLARAAQACGIEIDYWDIWGKQHLASAQSQTAILESLGVDASTSSSLEHSLEERSWRKWQRPLPPTVVVSEGDQPHQVVVSVPAGQANLPAVIRIRTEQGGLEESPFSLDQSEVEQELLLRGSKFVRKRITLPAGLPLGYHDLSIEIAGHPSEPARLIVCPRRAYEPKWLDSGRAAGIAISLYGVRSQRNWGCGDTTDLKTFIGWVAEQTGASFVAL